MFEFDPEKSKVNKKKHGIDFKSSLLLWNDPNRIEIPAKNVDEERFMLIGRLKDKVWSVIYTMRDTNIRIISVRRSRANEKEIYYGG